MMQEVERVELEVARDAADALLRIAGGQAFSFRIGVVGDWQWAHLIAPLGCLSVPPELGVERLELARCPKPLAAGVLRRVLETAKGRSFGNRCRNWGECDVQIDEGSEGVVIFLLKYTCVRTDTGAEEPTVPSVPRAKSGVHSTKRSAKSA